VVAVVVVGVPGGERIWGDGGDEECGCE